MAARSGKKVNVHINSGPVSPRFRQLGPSAPGVIYAIGAAEEEFSLLTDTSVSIVRGTVVLLDVHLNLANDVAVDVDLRAVVTDSVLRHFDARVLVTIPLVVYTDIGIIVFEYDQGDNISGDSYINSPLLEYLGKGLKFPFTFQRRSGGTQISTATSSDHAHIHESIRQILGTKKGERFMRPEFGSNLHKLIFEPNDRILYGLIRHEVVDALDKWEPRITVTDIVVEQGDDEHLVLVSISYRLISSQVEGNMVYPFYKESE